MTSPPVPSPNDSLNPYSSSNSPVAAGQQEFSLDFLLQKFTLTGQIVTLAMCGGAMFLTVAIVFMANGSISTGPNGTSNTSDSMLLVALGLGLVIVAGAASVLVPRVMLGRGIAEFQSTPTIEDLRRRMAPQTSATREDDLWKTLQDTPDAQSSVHRLLGSNVTSTLVGQALLEGAASVNLILLLLDTQPLHLLAVLVCIIGIAARMPTRGKVKSLITRSLSS